VGIVLVVSFFIANVLLKNSVFLWDANTYIAEEYHVTWNSKGYILNSSCVRKKLMDLFSCCLKDRY